MMVSLKDLDTHTVVKFSVLILIIAVLTIFFWQPILNIFSSLDVAREFILGFGFWAPIVFILLSAFQVLVAPIPGQLVGLSAGYIFGWKLGTVYGLIGLVLGSWVAFVLARKLGRPFVEKLVGKSNMEKFDAVSNDSGVFTLFLIYLLPGTPDDIVSLIAGLTNIKISKLMFLSALGRFPGILALAVMGQEIDALGTNYIIVLVIIMVLGSIIAYIYKKQLEDFTDTIMKKIKQKFTKKPQ